MSDSDNRKSSILFGPALVIAGTIVLWKNEGRFDYHRAASQTTPVSVIAEATEGDVISFTSSIDRGLALPDKYIESLQGYLIIERAALIYCWDRDEDDEGHVTWSMEWMGGVQRNSRNDGVRQQLSSGTLQPSEYALGELEVSSSSMEFVDPYQPVTISGLPLTDVAKNTRLRLQGNNLYLSKGRSDRLGDERIAYGGIPVPSTSTWFGKFSAGGGVAHQAQKKGGFFDSLIRDTGVLHHLVAGERDTALSSMKAHLTRLKWVVRFGGFVAVSFGFLIIFRAFASLLYYIPWIGWLVQWGVFVVSLFLGFVLTAVTIVGSYLFHHPLMLLAVLLVGGALFYFSRRRAAQQQSMVKASLDREAGHKLSRTELSEREFVELVQLALVDQSMAVEEKRYLRKWAKKQGWDKDKLAQMVAIAKRDAGDVADPEYSERHLGNLVRLALADGDLSAFELRTISTVAREVGYSGKQLRQMLDRIRQTAA